MIISIVIITIFLIFICSILLITISNWERNKLNVTCYEIHSPLLKKEHNFVFLSDLHEKEFGRNNSELLEKIDELDPEFILIGGDLITVKKVHDARRYVDRDEIDVSIKLLDNLKKKYTVYYAMGNHESRLFDKAGFNDCQNTVKYDKYIQDITKDKALRYKRALQDVILLDDDVASFDDFDITGLTLSPEFYKSLLFKKKKKLEEEQIQSKVGKTVHGRFHIMMLHSPLYYKEAIDHGIDLVLSGHFHGGSIRLPFLGALMTPQFQFLVKECAGKFMYKQGTLIVSRGLGTHSINIRINDLPEISFITIKP